MAQEIVKSNLKLLKEKLTGPASVQLFKDVIPTVPGMSIDQAEAVAKRYGIQVYTACLQTPKLAQCNEASLFREACKMAQLDLDIDMLGLAYLVPYKGNAQAIIGYKGLMELAYRSGRVKSITAEVIRESEKERIIITRIDGRISIEHPWGWEAPKGEVIAAYAVAHIEGCDPMTCLLRKDEIEAYRAKSAAPNGFGWTDNYDAMCKKTSIRRLSTVLPKSILKSANEILGNEDRQDFASARATAKGMIDEQAGSEMVDAVFEQPTQEDQVEDQPDWMNEEL